jgi:tetratricopeptide (TPR) repeat protein
MGVLSNLVRTLGLRTLGRHKATSSEVRSLMDRGLLRAAEEAAHTLPIDTPNDLTVQMCLHGELAFRQRRDTEAEKHFRDALALAPGMADAHYGLSLLMLDRHETDAALRHAQFAVNNGTAARLSAQLGLCEMTLKNFARAASSLKRATRLDPLDKASWNNLGIVWRAHGQMKQARMAFSRAIAIDDGFVPARENLRLLEEDALALGISLDAKAIQSSAEEEGVLGDVRQLRRMGELDEAIDACEKLCTKNPDNASIAIELFAIYRELGDTQSGLDALEAFRVRHPDDIDAAAALGKALIQHDEHKLAKPMIEQALGARPDDVGLLLLMADIRGEQDRHADAGVLYERAYALEQTMLVRGQLAANLVRQCRYEEAMTMIDGMVSEDPSAEDGLLSIKVYALTYLGRYEEAEPLIARAVANNPNDPNARWPRSCVRLLHEQFAEGWDEYSYRNLNSTSHLRMVPFPMWRGEDVHGKTLLVLAEQGLGDQVMFTSCLPDLLALAPARTIVEVVKRVAPTVARSFPTCEVISTKQDDAFTWVRDLGPVDYFVMIGDLPRRFRRRREDFPHHDGYLRADAGRLEYWREQLRALGPKPKIGVSWRGGTEATRRVVRTMDVTKLLPMAQAIDADWVNLQYGEVDEDLARAKAAGIYLRSWPSAIQDLDEFAALISALDLVVTVCNTTVHYAGALGRPVWVMAPRVPEWRYGLTSVAMPWYPSSRMYRQPRDGDWGSVLESICRDLRAMSWAGLHEQALPKIVTLP